MALTKQFLPPDVLMLIKLAYTVKHYINTLKNDTETRTNESESTDVLCQYDGKIKNI